MAVLQACSQDFVSVNRLTRFGEGTGAHRELAFVRLDDTVPKAVNVTNVIVVIARLWTSS